MALDQNIYADFLDARETFRYVNVFTNLNMEFVQSTLGSAESGRLGDLYQLYELIEASETRLKGMINNRRKAVTKNAWEISAADLDDDRAVEAANFIRNQIHALKWKAYLSELMDGRIYGIQIHQKTWKRIGDKLMLASLTAVDKGKYAQANYANGYQFADLDFGEIVVNKYYAGTSEISAKKLLEENAITIAIDKNAKGKYDLQGVMRGIARWYLVKLFAIQSWAQFAEKFGFPTVLAKMSKEDFLKSGSLAKQLLSSVGPAKYGVLLEEMEHEIHNPASTANIDVFDRLIQVANTEMAIGILGQNLTTDISGGSFAASKTHLEVLQTIIEDDAMWIDEIVNDQIIKPLIRLNFPDLDKELCPTYSTVMPEQIDVDVIARGLTQASKIIPIPLSHIYERLHIPEPQDDEPTIGGSGNNLLEEIMNA